MNYRHGFHAGNFADVAKHAALVLILRHLQRKPTPFAVIDTHAGRGLYDLSGEVARRTGEALGGIERLRDVPGPEAWMQYRTLAAENGADSYPGSPLITARMMRPQDRLVAIEKHPEEAAALARLLAPFARARAETGDGYARLAALLPPPERRGLVLIDPPFEAPDEFAQVAEALRNVTRRFATGIYLVWYPVKSAAAARAFCGEVLASATAPLLNVEIGIAAAEGKLARAGLLVLNPPFGFDEAMREILDLVTPHLSVGTASVEWLRGET